MPYFFQLLGSASLGGPSGPVSGRAGHRVRLGLLALLAVAGTRGCSRDTLVAKLWPETPTGRARRRLSHALYALRKELDGDPFTLAGDRIWLNQDVVRADVTEFLEALAAGDEVRAAALYGGPFLDGFHLPGSGAFEEWLDAERSRLEELRAGALERLAGEAEAAGDPARASGRWRELLASDPYNSRTALHLVESLRAAGEPAKALQQAIAHVRFLREELDLSAPPELEATIAELRTEATPGGREGEAPTALKAAVGPGRGEPPMAPEDSFSHLPPTRIAVLPFVNLGSGPESEFFSDGMTFDIINHLAKVRGLRVTSSTSSMRYKGTAKGLQQIGEELGVGSILEGEVQQAGGRVQINAQLVDVRTDEHLWAGTFQREMSDIFSIQSEVAREVVAALEAALSPSEAERIERRPTDDLEAYALYLKGRHFWNYRGADLWTGLKFFRQALELDPDYPLAHAGIADSYNLLGFFGEIAPLEAMHLARTAALRALEVDEELAEAHAALGFVHFYFGWNLSAAEEEFRRTTELNPSYVPVHNFWGGACGISGHPEEAVRLSRRAQELDPLSPFASAHLGWMLAGSGNLDAARDQLQRALGLDPEFPLAHWLLGWVFSLESKPGEAIPSFEKAVGLSDGLPWFAAHLGWAYGKTGVEHAARRILKGLTRQRGSRFVRSLSFALVHAGLGEVEAALQALEQAFRERDPWIQSLKIDPFLSGLQGEVRYQALIKAVQENSKPAG